jgi:hypothetical protein
VLLWPGLELLRLRLWLVLRLMLIRLVVLRLMLIRLVVLRLMLIRLVVLRLVVLRLMLIRLVLLARIERLRLARRERLAGHAGLLVIAVVVTVIGQITAHAAALRLLLEIGLGLAQLFLCGGDQAEIMFGVLIIIFGGDRISGTLRVAGQLQIFFRDVGCRSSNFHVLAVRLVHPRQRILVVAALAIASAHTFVVLTVSHGLLFRQPRCLRRHRRRRFCSPNFTSPNVIQIPSQRLRTARNRSQGTSH